MSVCPYVSALAGISLKFDIGGFQENLSRKAKFIYNWTKLSSTLHTGLGKCYVWRHIQYP